MPVRRPDPERRSAALLAEAPDDRAAAARADAARWIEDEMSVWPRQEVLPWPNP